MIEAVINCRTTIFYQRIGSTKMFENNCCTLNHLAPESTSIKVFFRSGCKMRSSLQNVVEVRYFWLISFPFFPQNCKFCKKSWKKVKFEKGEIDLARWNPKRWRWTLPSPERFLYKFFLNIEMTLFANKNPNYVCRSRFHGTTGIQVECDCVDCSGQECFPFFYNNSAISSSQFP